MIWIKAKQQIFFLYSIRTNLFIRTFNYLAFDQISKIPENIACIKRQSCENAFVLRKIAIVIAQNYLILFFIWWI